MNNRQVEAYLPRAYDALRECGIARKPKDKSATYEYEIPSSFRGKIAAYGAAISIGNLQSGTAFYSEQGNASDQRQDLMRAIFWILHEDAIADAVGKADLFLYIREHNTRATRESVLAAATALKLAMNLYHLVREKEEGDAEEE